MTRVRLAWLLALVLLSPLVACDDKLPVQSFVEKLRVLGVRAEPPEIAPGETTALSALVVQPPKRRAENPTPVSYLWISCSVPPGAQQLVPCGVADLASIPPSCDADPAAAICLLGEQPTATYTPNAASVGADGTAQRLITMVASETEGGAIGCLVDTAANNGIPVDPDRCVITLKRLVISTATANPTKNHNPVIVTFDLALGLDDDMLDTRMSLLDGAARYEIAPAKKKPTWHLIADRADDASELKSDGRYEELSLAWYITAGKLAGARSVFEETVCQGDGCNKTPPPMTVDAKWTAPTAEERLADVPADGLTEFWAIVRDDRGGIGWLYGSARPTP